MTEQERIESNFRQFVIDIKTLAAYSGMDYYNDVNEKISLIVENLKKTKERVHEDDDNTHAVLRDMIDHLESAICCTEDLKFYDGDGNRLRW